MNAYAITLWLHSYLRWVVLALAALVFARTAHGVLRGRPWERSDERVHVAFVAAVDTQFTLGLLLYVFLSPFVRAFYADAGAGMKVAVLRFFGIEHVFSMVIAVALDPREPHAQQAACELAGTASQGVDRALLRAAADPDRDPVAVHALSATALALIRPVWTERRHFERRVHSHRVHNFV